MPTQLLVPCLSTFLSVSFELGGGEYINHPNSVTAQSAIGHRYCTLEQLYSAQKKYPKNAEDLPNTNPNDSI
jgi:hypothetical protein